MNPYLLPSQLENYHHKGEVGRRERGREGGRKREREEEREGGKPSQEIEKKNKFCVTLYDLLDIIMSEVLRLHSYYYV